MEYGSVGAGGEGNVVVVKAGAGPSVVEVAPAEVEYGTTTPKGALADAEYDCAASVPVELPVAADGGTAVGLFTPLGG